MDLLTKSAHSSLEVKALNEKGEFEGYASTFGGEPDLDGDIIQAGAYAVSLQEHKSAGTMPKMFWQHNAHEPIGKWLEAKEDDRGLFVKGKLNMGVQRAREAYELIKEGDIEGLSIGYRIKEYSSDTETGVWTLERLDLREISVVSIGANTIATIGSVKSARKSVELIEKLKSGSKLTTREFETLLKGSLGFSNSEAERAVRGQQLGQGDLAKNDDAMRFLTALQS